MTLMDTFERGDYAQILSSTVDGRGGFHGGDDLAQVVGALCFVGRLSEAKALFEAHAPGASPETIVSARFFLAVAACRHYDFATSARLLTANARARHGLRGTHARFYVLQGLAFYRYTYGRLRQAAGWARRAHLLSVKENFLYGRVLSSELLAHLLASEGRVHEALDLFAQTATLAETLGQGAVSQAVSCSVLLYRSNFGIGGPKSTAALREALDGIKFEDSYTRASILLELARASLLAGKASDAKESLDEACHHVYRIRNFRLEMLLNLRLAAFQRYQGESRQALNLVRNASSRLQEKVDLQLLLRARGLELALVAELGLDGDAARLRAELVSLTRRTGLQVSHRILERDSGRYLVESGAGSDPLGDLLDSVARDGCRSVPAILRSGWLGLLPRALGFPPASRALCFDLGGRGLTVFDAGDVRHFPEAIAPLQRRLLLRLGDGECSKETLTEALWERSYHPLRHDSLIYALISKVRKWLGAGWIEVTELGYRLAPGVRVLAPAPSDPHEALSSALPFATEELSHPFSRAEGSGTAAREHPTEGGSSRAAGLAAPGVGNGTPGLSSPLSSPPSGASSSNASAMGSIPAARAGLPATGTMPASGVHYRLPSQGTSKTAGPHGQRETLNARQLRMAKLLRAPGTALDVRRCMALFEVSAITASRDLSGLEKLGLARRVGRARSTQYIGPATQ